MFFLITFFDSICYIFVQQLSENVPQQQGGGVNTLNLQNIVGMDAFAHTSQDELRFEHISKGGRWNVIHFTASF